MQQVAARALAAAEHARSLFAVSPALVPAAGAVLESAAESMTGAGRRADGLSGELADRHCAFTGTAARILTDSSSTESALHGRLRAAAAVTRAGAHRLDDIAVRTRGIAATAAGAQTPVAQRTVAQALHRQLAQADTAVKSAERQASTIAGRIRVLSYGFGDPVFGEPHSGAAAVPLDALMPPDDWHIVVCEPYTPGGGYMCWWWFSDGSTDSRWNRKDISGAWP